MLKNINKYKNKNHLINSKNKINNSILYFGDLGLMSLNKGYINEKELNSCKKIILKKIKFIGGKKNLIMKVNPFLGKTFKSLNSRMGKGKGLIEKWILPIKKGMILFEIKCNLKSKIKAQSALNLAANSLSIKTKLIENIY